MHYFTLFSQLNTTVKPVCIYFNKLFSSKGSVFLPCPTSTFNQRYWLRRILRNFKHHINLNTHITHTTVKYFINNLVLLLRCSHSLDLYGTYGLPTAQSCLKACIGSTLLPSPEFNHIHRRKVHLPSH